MLELYQVDAFSNKVFGGNPAAVVPLASWPVDSLMQSIAAENNLAETAFIAPVENDEWAIRWFTPLAEVALCGHATLASAHVLFKHIGFNGSTITFRTNESGNLRVSQTDDGRMSMAFPSISLTTSSSTDAVSTALGSDVDSCWRGDYSATEYDLVAVFKNEASVAALQADPAKFKVLGSRGIIATAPGDQCDFVSRYFAPEIGIPEDPVTGSAHCLLAPFWADKLDKPALYARQISKRGGQLECRVAPNQVELIGNAVDYMKGVINLKV